MNDKVFKKFIKAYKLVQDLDDEEFDFLITELMIFKRNPNSELPSVDDIDKIESDLNSK